MANMATTYDLNPIGPEEVEWSTKMGEKRMAARREQESGKMEKVGTAMKVSGGAMQVGGVGANLAGKGMQAGGRALMQAGAGLSSTGLGAIAGVPLSVAGGAMAAAGTGMSVSGKAAEKTGKGVRKTGRQVSAVAKLRQAKNKAGLNAKVSEKIEKKIEDIVKKKILCGIPGVSAVYGAYVCFINFVTVAKEKKIKFSLWDWMLIIISNIELIAFTLGGLVIIFMMVDFMEGSWVNKIEKIFKAFTGLGWSGVKDLIFLFNPFTINAK